MSLSTTADCKCRITTDFNTLRQTEIFADAPPEVTKLFAYLARHRLVKPGEIIINQGAPADSCYFIIKGEVDIITLHNDQEIVMQRIGEKSFFGELALLARFKWFFAARAVSETELLITTRESFQKVLERFPERRDKLTEKVIQLRISRLEIQTAYMLDRLLAAGLAAGDTGQPLIK